MAVSDDFSSLPCVSVMVGKNAIGVHGHDVLLTPGPQCPITDLQHDLEEDCVYIHIFLHIGTCKCTVNTQVRNVNIPKLRSTIFNNFSGNIDYNSARGQLDWSQTDICQFVFLRFW